VAKKYGGEVISADSRQVYKGLDIGTGKITKKEMGGIPHHLLDVASPKEQFTAQDFQTKGGQAIKKIFKKNKLPIICGGTGFYIDALIYKTQFPSIPPNKTLRTKLEKKTPEELFKILKNKDPERAMVIDQHNKRRLIRALEIVETLGKVPQLHKTLPYKILYIALDPVDLDIKIHARLKARIKQGLIKEGETLHKKGLSYKRMRELGLEYKYLADLLQEKITKEEFTEQLEKEIRRYAKRQMTWFKKQKNVLWFKPNETKKISTKVEKFLAL